MSHCIITSFNHKFQMQMRDFSHPSSVPTAQEETPLNGTVTAAAPSDEAIKQIRELERTILDLRQSLKDIHRSRDDLAAQHLHLQAELEAHVQQSVERASRVRELEANVAKLQAALRDCELKAATQATELEAMRRDAADVAHELAATKSLLLSQEQTLRATQAELSDKSNVCLFQCSTHFLSHEMACRPMSPWRVG